MTDSDVIIVGAGLGGLTAGAYLARAGRQVRVLEASTHVGGKARHLMVHGLRFPVGANTFGSAALRSLAELGHRPAVRRAPIGLRYRGASLTFPMTAAVFKEARKVGIRAGTVMRVASKMLAPGRVHRRLDCRTYREVVDRLFTQPALREILYIEAWLLGTRPELLPAYAFEIFFGRQFGFHRPFYPAEGAGAVAASLRRVIEAGGGAVETGAPVEHIVVERGRAIGVSVSGRMHRARQAVISNCDIRATLALLSTGGGDAGLAELTARSRRYRAAYPLAAVLIAARRETPLLATFREKGAVQTSTILQDASVLDCMDALDEGQCPPTPILNIVGVEALIAAERGQEELPFVVTAFWPRRPATPAEGEAFVAATIERVEQHAPGFRRSVLWTKFLDPPSYEREVGVDSCPAPVLDSFEYEKEPFALPVARMFGVGTTFLPRGAHTGAAIESGRRCAAEVLRVCA